MKNMLNNKKGAVLTVVLVTIGILVLLGGYILRMALNQRRLGDTLSITKVQNYYRAQAGVVDAFWRIRVNDTNTADGPITGTGAGAGPENFETDDWDPDPYSIDLGTNTVHFPARSGDDVRVNIGPVTEAGGIGPPGLRKVESTGLA